MKFYPGHKCHSPHQMIRLDLFPLFHNTNTCIGREALLRQYLCRCHYHGPWPSMMPYKGVKVKVSHPSILNLKMTTYFACFQIIQGLLLCTMITSYNAGDANLFSFVVFQVSVRPIQTESAAINIDKNHFQDSSGALHVINGS